jgi:dodecin
MLRLRHAEHGAPHPFGTGIPMLGLPRGRSTCVLPNSNGRTTMADSVYKVIELVGTSKDSWEKAAAAAVNRASKSLRDLRVAEVVQLDMQLDAKGKIEAYRAKLKVSFKFEG